MGRARKQKTQQQGRDDPWQEQCKNVKVGYIVSDANETQRSRKLQRVYSKMYRFNLILLTLWMLLDNLKMNKCPILFQHVRYVMMATNMHCDIGLDFVCRIVLLVWVSEAALKDQCRNVKVGYIVSDTNETQHKRSHRRKTIRRKLQRVYSEMYRFDMILITFWMLLDNLKMKKCLILFQHVRCVMKDDLIPYWK